MMDDCLGATPGQASPSYRAGLEPATSEPLPALWPTELAVPKPSIIITEIVVNRIDCRHLAMVSLIDRT